MRRIFRVARTNYWLLQYAGDLVSAVILFFCLIGVIALLADSALLELELRYLSSLPSKG